MNELADSIKQSWNMPPTKCKECKSFYHGHNGGVYCSFCSTKKEQHNDQ